MIKVHYSWIDMIGHVYPAPDTSPQRGDSYNITLADFFLRSCFGIDLQDIFRKELSKPGDISHLGVRVHLKFGTRDQYKGVFFCQVRP